MTKPSERGSNNRKRQPSNQAIFRDPSKYPVKSLECWDEYVKETKASLSGELFTQPWWDLVCAHSDAPFHIALAKKESAYAFLAVFKTDPHLQHKHR
jgi:hypothetical protein